MEEVLRQLLEGQKHLIDGQKQLFEGQKQLFQGQGRIEGRLDAIEGRLDAIEGRLENVEGQVQENSGFIKALVHQSEYQRVQMDQLILTTSRMEGDIKSIRIDLGAVEAITAKNWNEIIQLRVAK